MNSKVYVKGVKGLPITKNGKIVAIQRSIIVWRGSYHSSSVIHRFIRAGLRGLPHITVL